tara:strand:- start:369 stop:704 length:336 start_codon:yes stop_codon:yes gene_type:complete
MGKYASGRFAKRISDRSGLAFPYNEMVQEWNGSWVHTSEFEAKHPQLEPLSVINDPQSLQYAKPQVVSAKVMLGINLYAGNIFESNGMMPVEDNKDIEIKSFLGKVEVIIS